MLVLTQPKSQDGCSVFESVLDVFAKEPCPGRDPPVGLTASDSAYLTALYASNAQALKESEYNDIAGRMASILIKGSADAGGQ
jgi:hypothetical protein